MLTITLTNSDYSLEKDIQVNSQQKITDTLTILNEAGVLQSIQVDAVRVKSLRRGVYLDTRQNYEQEDINTGDILELI